MRLLHFDIHRLNATMVILAGDPDRRGPRIAVGAGSLAAGAAFGDYPVMLYASSCRRCDSA